MRTVRSIYRADPSTLAVINYRRRHNIRELRHATKPVYVHVQRSTMRGVIRRTLRYPTPRAYYDALPRLVDNHPRLHVVDVHQ